MHQPTVDALRAQKAELERQAQEYLESQTPVQRLEFTATEAIKDVTVAVYVVLELHAENAATKLFVDGLEQADWQGIVIGLEANGAKQTFIQVFPLDEKAVPRHFELYGENINRVKVDGIELLIASTPSKSDVFRDGKNLQLVQAAHLIVDRDVTNPRAILEMAPDEARLRLTDAQLEAVYTPLIEPESVPQPAPRRSWWQNILAWFSRK